MNRRDIYYTPEIEEFHVGFQYEVSMYMLEDYKINSREELTRDVKWITDMGIAPKPCHQHWFRDTFRASYKLGDMTKVRVKYLDEEDLNDCGFTVVGMPWQYFDGIHMLVDLNDNMIRIDHIADEQCLFYGKIKNLSEFRKLLKQLDIRYDRN